MLMMPVDFTRTALEFLLALFQFRLLLPQLKRITDMLVLQLVGFRLGYGVLLEPFPFALLELLKSCRQIRILQSKCLYFNFELLPLLLQLRRLFLALALDFLAAAIPENAIGFQFLHLFV